MRAIELLSYLRDRDIKLFVDDDKLRYNAPPSALTPNLREELIEHKLEIIKLIRDANGKLLPIRAVSRNGNLPLSFAQQRLWFLDQMEPGNPAYNIPTTYHFRGILNITALEQSLKEIVKRHESLRTTFSVVDGQPVQVITPFLSVALPIVNLQKLTEEKRETEVLHLVSEEAQRPFDLAHGPLLRTILFRLNEEEHILLVTMHHIVSDGWSMGNLYRELTALYEAFSVGKPSPLLNLPIQYADYAIWQQQWLQSETFKEQQSYWSHQLVDLPMLELPTDRSRPAIQTYRGAKQKVKFSKAMSESLKKLSQREGATLFMTLLTAFKILLHHYSGQDDIVVGFPIAGRNRTEIEKLIGFFINTLVLRTDLSGNPTFRELLGRVSKTALDAYAHQDMPLEKKLVEALQSERDLSRPPLFQVLFAFQNIPKPELKLSGLTLTQVEVNRNTTQLDLSLYVSETGEGLRGYFEYNTDLFDNSTIIRMQMHLQTLLESIVSNPDQRISDLPILNDKSIEDTYPLSPMQQGMLFHSLQDVHSGIYIEQMVMNLHENLNVPAFIQSWQQVIARHPVLRTSFEWARLKVPFQLVHHQVKLPLEEQDWSGLSTKEQEDSFQTYLRTDRERGFDLTKLPLMRLAIFRLAEADYRCLWTFHHILLDGRSFTVLLKEVFSFYESICHGQVCSVPPPHPYREYIEWLRQQPLDEAKDFWQVLLKGFANLISLSSGNHENLESCHSEQNIRLSANITATLQTFAEEHQLTLNTLIQGAWAILLSRYSGENDIVFGTTRAGRHFNDEAAESMVGLFINTLPVRVLISHIEPLINLLQALRTQTIALREHEHTPLIKIQEWSEVPTGTALFESILVFENYQLNTALRAQGEKWEQREFQLFERTNYPLTVSGYADSELLLSIEYELSHFGHETIARMLEHLKTLLKGMSEKGLKQSIIDLPMLTRAEQQQLLIEWNDTHREFTQDLCIHQLFEVQVDRTPDAVAVVFEEEVLTYQELNWRANQLARLLRSFGIGPEVTVGICIERSIDMVVGLLGVLKAGGAYLPLDSKYPRERLAYMLADCQTPIVLTQRHLLDNMPEYNGRLICLDGDWSTIAQPKVENLKSNVTTDNLAYIIYTSGSTGKPKGVMIEHRALVNLTEAVSREYSIIPGDRILQFASISFDASAEEVYPCLTRGATLVLRTEEMLSSAETFVQGCRDFGVTVLDLPTAYWHLLSDELDAVDLKFPESLRLIIIGGESARPAALGKWFTHAPGDIHLINTYGPTEATVVATMCELSDGNTRTVCEEENPMKSVMKTAEEQENDSLSSLRSLITEPLIGHPIWNVEVYVLGEDIRLIPVSASGELYIGGSGLARGYMNYPELTAERFIPNLFGEDPGMRFYKTGDQCRWHQSGNLEFLKRLDKQTKIRGFRIELGEIEAVLGQHPAVRETLVLTKEDEPGNKRLVGYVVPEKERKPAISELRGFLTHKLPDYMVPSAFVILDSFPLTPSGKVDRKALPEPDKKRVDLENAFVGPRTPIEELLAGIWCDVLGVKKMGIYDNFFELGGHSLLAVQVLYRLREIKGKSFPLAHFFQSPTIAGLAEYFSRKNDQSLSVNQDFYTLCPIQTSGTRAPFFWIHSQMISFLPKYLGQDQPLYAIVAQGVDGKRVRYKTMKEITAHYLREIRTVQPKGPYFLGGFCWGGKYAFDIAHQLLRQGEDVGLLFVVEPALSPANSNRTFIDKLYPQLGWYRWKRFLKYRFWRLRCERIISEAHLKIGRRMSPSLSVRYALDVIMQTYRDFVQRTYPKEIVLIQAEKGDHPVDADWSSLAEGEVTVLVAEGATHMDMLQEPGAGVWAGWLNTYLSKAQAICSETEA